MNHREYHGGAISPYEYYLSEVKPLYDELESYKGSSDYYINWSKIFPKIEPKREKYIGLFPPVLIGTAILKIALDYYAELKYDAKDVEGSKIDDEYNIDIIAEKDDEIIVTQVKAGEISNQEIKKFLINAPKYILEHHKKKELKELDIVFYSLGNNAKDTFVKESKKLIKAGFVPHTISLETVCDIVPRYRRVFKEIKKLH